MNYTGADRLLLEWRERCAQKDREIERLRAELDVATKVNTQLQTAIGKERDQTEEMLKAFRSVLFGGEFPALSKDVAEELVAIARRVKAIAHDEVIFGTVHWIKESLVPFVHDEIIHLQSASSERKS